VTLVDRLMLWSVRLPMFFRLPLPFCAFRFDERMSAATAASPFKAAWRQRYHSGE
jgi:hypothetical protein